MASRLGTLGQTLQLCLRQRCIQMDNSKRSMKRWVVPTLREMKNRKDKMGPEKPSHRNTFVEWNYNAEVYAFGKRLGEDFEDDLLRQALTERSYIIKEEMKQKEVGIDEPLIALKDNAEFVKPGEKLMSDYIMKFLHTVYPIYPEEGICAVKDFLMSEKTLADISTHIGTSEIILCADFPVENTTLSNVLKAIIYALSQSSGEDRSNLFIRDFIITYLSGKDINDLWTIQEPLQVLSKILERDGRAQVEPRIIAEAGRNTILATYQIGLYSDKKLIGVGFGESVDVAKEMAAFDALKRLFKLTEKARPIPFNLELPLNSKPPFPNLSVQDWCEKNVGKLIS